jgi:protein phosphatase
MSDLEVSLDPELNEEAEDPNATARFNRDELVKGWREYEASLPKVIPALKYAPKTDMGQVRENNEDKFDYYEPENYAVLAARGCLFAVGDGVGGALAGQVASEMTMKGVIAHYYQSAAPTVSEALTEAVVATNDKVYSLAQRMPERSGMGSTLTATVFIEDKVYVAQLGDSRAYLIRDNAIRQVTYDHSWVEEQVRAGILSRENAETSPFRNVITRSIGAMATAQPDVFEEEARVGDVWVLCSDGLSNYVEDEEIGKIAGGQAPSEAARQFIELANSRGGRDNITVFVIAVRGLIPIS